MVPVFSIAADAAVSREARGGPGVGQPGEALVTRFQQPWTAYNQALKPMRTIQQAPPKPAMKAGCFTTSEMLLLPSDPVITSLSSAPGGPRHNESTSTMLHASISLESTTTHRGTLDLKAAMLQQGKSWILSKQIAAILSPEGGGFRMPAWSLTLQTGRLPDRHHHILKPTSGGGNGTLGKADLRAEDRLPMLLMNRWGLSHTFKRHKSPSSRQEVVQVFVSVAISFSHFQPQLPSPVLH
ncbi:hypothetical protein EYF80_002939 [Liparis tanakae]|uniref:Uncharacterized protein n=1 Tax=Liparis tanakae TaxID=230148 RepID=A0A4Z2J961_9TELE|nr:hypothetical protein EYF80_002939 [Liparis tanakae]